MHGSLDIKSNYILERVSDRPELFLNKDPVRPELDVYFKTSMGREVFGLKNSSEEFVAFICIGFTDHIPKDTDELDIYSDPSGHIAIAYSVWSYSRGAGRATINCILDMAKQSERITRVVTLSPLTKMAEDFHIKNGAIKLSENEKTANFEYII